MHQHDLVEQLVTQLGWSAAQSERLIHALVGVISRSLNEGEPIQISGFGTFDTVKYPVRRVEDPPGSGNIVIALPRIEPSFSSDQILIEAVLRAQQEYPERFLDTEDEEDDESEIDAEPIVDADPENPVIEDDEPDIEEAAPEPVAQVEPVDDDLAAVVAKLATPEVFSQSVSEPVTKESPVGDASYVEFVELTRLKIEPEVLHMIPFELAKRYKAVPIDLKEGILTVAMIDPEDFDVQQAIKKSTGLSIKPVLTTKDDISFALDQYTGLQGEVQEVITAAEADLGLSEKDIKEAAQEVVDQQSGSDAPTTKIVFSLLRRAVKEKASDIHIEPYEQKVIVRFRIDGVLLPQIELPKVIQSAVTSRLKILSNLKIDETRLPQDGRFSISLDHRQVDFRLSTVPVVYGEKVVMRILDKSVGMIGLEEVGLIDHGLKVLKQNMERSHGMILVTGPTGSGKTTTLYSVLGKMMSDTVNILTLEDPVEYRIESINQSQVHSEIGYTFASGLRAAVRQDPDIIMLGEIRDQETADMAVHAALTGHMVLSTLHTNDAAGSFPRLIDMKIEPFLITSSLHTVIAQRLTRKICPECREEIPVPPETLAEIEKEIAHMPTDLQAELAKEPIKLFHGKGCDACNNKGYRGRIGVFEVLNVTEPIRDIVIKRGSGEAIKQQAISEGMITMIQDGIVKANRGMTTIEEVWRVTKE